MHNSATEIAFSVSGHNFVARQVIGGAWDVYKDNGFVCDVVERGGAAVAYLRDLAETHEGGPSVVEAAARLLRRFSW